MLAAAAVVLTMAVVVGLLLTDNFRKISQQTAYNRVNEATQSLVMILGQNPARHPTFAYISHCDNGMGGNSGWRVGGSSSMQAVTPDQAAALGKSLEAALRSAGYSDVKLTVDGPNVNLRGNGDGAQVYLNYRPSDTKDILGFGATTDCDVAVGPHDIDNDAGYPLKPTTKGICCHHPGWEPVQGREVDGQQIDRLLVDVHQRPPPHGDHHLMGTTTSWGRQLPPCSMQRCYSSVIGR